MSLIALVSAKHSPGVTTAALAMALAGSPDHPTTVAEVDPAGGDTAALLGLTTEPGLTSLASSGRRAEMAVDLDSHVQSLGPGVDVLGGPPSGAHASAAIRCLGARLADALAARKGTVYADCGRWEVNSPAASIVAAADTVLVLLRPTLEGVEHVRTRLDSLPRVTKAILVGDRPYGPDEVSRALGVDVAGVLPLDTRGADALRHRLTTSAAARSTLGRAARTVVVAVNGTINTRVGAGA